MKSKTNNRRGYKLADQVNLTGTYTDPYMPTINVQASLHPGTDLQIELKPSVTGDERAFMDGLESTTGTWYTNTNGYVAAHETMHAYGLDDTYTDGPWATTSPGLMGTYGDTMTYGEAANLYQTYCGAGNPSISSNLETADIDLSYYHSVFHWL